LLASHAKGPPLRGTFYCVRPAWALSWRC